MKPLDEKTIDELNAAERGKAPRSKWRTLVVLLTGLALLIAGSLVGVETYRHAQINDARQRLDHEAARVEKRYKNVTDWHKWYVDRLPEGCEHTALSDWIIACDESEIAEGSVASWLGMIPPDLSAPEYKTDPHPNDNELRHFLNASQPLADEAHLLLTSAHLAIVPDLPEGVPQFSILPTFRAFDLLLSRVTALRMLGETDRAWAEVLDALRLVQHWDRPSALIEFAIQAGAERSIIKTIFAMLRDSRPDKSALEGLRIQPAGRTTLGREMIEYEIAFFAQVFGTLTPEERAEWVLYEGENQAAWFPYLKPDLSWNERKAAFSGESEMTLATADYLRSVLNVLEDPALGIDDLDPTSPLILPFQRVPSLVNELALYRQGLTIASELLLAESREELLAAAARLLASSKDFEIITDASAITFRVRYEDTVLRRLEPERSFEDEEQFYLHFDPVVVPMPE